MTGRRLAASALTLVWLQGLHLLPLVHNIDHRPDHTHGPAKRAHAHPHPHPHPHEHDAPEPSSDDHGKGSLLHYALALVEEDAPAIVEPGPAVVAISSFAPLEPDSAHRLTYLARGPPVI